MVPLATRYKALMHFISTHVHGVLDYVFATLLIISPYTVDYAGDPMAEIISIAIGSFIILYSLFTNYELGIVKKISMNAHLSLDLGGAIVLGLSPWIFGFAGYVWKPQVIFAVIAILIVAFSETRSPGWRHRQNGDKVMHK